MLLHRLKFLSNFAQHASVIGLSFTIFGSITPVCADVTSASAAGKPNILILHADQWRAQAFGYAGDKEAITPNIDKLAADSANFCNAISPLPVCSPARASMLTGQRPLTNGVFMNDIRLSADAVTLAEVLGGAGYQTGYIGKWHLDGNDRSSFTPPGPRRQGFQYWKALNCSHAYNHSAYYDNDDPARRYWPGYDVFAQGKDAQAYISTHAHETQPFFLVLAWGPPHDPYNTAPEKYKKMYNPAKLTMRPNVPAEMRSKALKDKASYYAHITAIDDMLGQIIQTLKQKKLYDNTIILFTSDHGDLLASHGLYGKQAPWDESIRVPMLLHYSGERALTTGTYNAMITCEDIMPTLLGLAGVNIPSSVEGKDFSGYVRGGVNPKPEVADIMCVQPFSSKWGRKSGGIEYRGIRTPRYTYARSLEGPWLLYDNQVDPYQIHNLIGDEKTSGIQAQLDSLLQARLKEHKDKFLPGPEYAKLYHYPKLDASGAVPYIK